METNVNVCSHQELHSAAEELLEAARKFWRLHRKMGGPRAVVWLTGTSGELVVFTRGDYREQIMHNISPLSEETPLHFD